VVIIYSQGVNPMTLLDLLKDLGELPLTKHDLTDKELLELKREGKLNTDDDPDPTGTD